MHSYTGLGSSHVLCHQYITFCWSQWSFICNFVYSFNLWACGNDNTPFLFFVLKCFANFPHKTDIVKSLNLNFSFKLNTNLELNFSLSCHLLGGDEVWYHGYHVSWTRLRGTGGPIKSRSTQPKGTGQEAHNRGSLEGNYGIKSCK
jgi:hypothetical protein